MKKIILILILAIGFISESKAQFPASSEIYIYIQTDTSWENTQVHFIRFLTNGRLVKSYRSIKHCAESLSDDYNPFDREIEYVRNAQFNKYGYGGYVYKSTISTEKYCAYKFEPQSNSHLFFTKDRNEMISYDIIDRKYVRYYKRTTKSELESLVKERNMSQFDFLE